MHIPFHLLTLFCSKKNMHLTQVKPKPTQTHMSTKCSPELVVGGCEHQKPPKRIIHAFVANVDAFCLAYPDEPICKNCFIQEAPCTKNHTKN